MRKPDAVQRNTNVGGPRKRVEAASSILAERLRTGAMAGALALATVVAHGCGSDLTGTYANPVVTLELRSEGDATLNSMGSAESCTYSVDAKDLKVKCPETGEHDLTILDDGALNSFYGRLEKR